MTDQIEAYECERYLDEPIPQARMLHSLLDNKRMTASELASATAIDEASIRAVLFGNRSLNDSEKTTIARVFCVGPEVFD